MKREIKNIERADTWVGEFTRANIQNNFTVIIRPVRNQPQETDTLQAQKENR